MAMTTAVIGSEDENDETRTTSLDELVTAGGRINHIGNNDFHAAVSRPIALHVAILAKGYESCSFQSNAT